MELKVFGRYAPLGMASRYGQNAFWGSFVITKRINPTVCLQQIWRVIIRLSMMNLLLRLLAIVRNGAESEELRARAVISLRAGFRNSAYFDGFEDPEDVPISEETFHEIQGSLRELYLDIDVPMEVRRRTLEGSVRAPQEWHQEAVRNAYSGGDALWRLTAVFCMRYIQGFETQILEALKAENEDIHYEAVCSRGDLGSGWRLVSHYGSCQQ